ncbi:ribose-phosphate diphosphokinase [Aestuariicella hydrocarbonica]|uniref:Ribose-phosphate diphosphokinase n=1 Tax=Pseudomaricurvus hydrocarbonicus TaxID=1470433 RepID=A0A9E5JSI6_9GAMM|nr:ribose-phosphate diphosphokinase [Aestuariicella hydrocarbonica]
MPPSTSITLFDLTGKHSLTALLARELRADIGHIEQRTFPDGETYLRITSPSTDTLTDTIAVVLADLSQPNSKFLLLAFLCDALRDTGVQQVGLIAPYLCYMRQDTRFKNGEAITSQTFARLLSRSLDWLITVDPHLHRYRTLSEIYTIPTQLVHAAPTIVEWLSQQPSNLLLVGPDAESEQWVSMLAKANNRPYVVGNKHRYGDREVVIELPDLRQFQGRRALIFDDVISSGRTILQCLKSLQAAGFNEIDCVVVHAVFGDQSEALLKAQGLRQMFTTNTLPHPSNRIDLSRPLAQATREMLQSQIN